MSQMVVTFRKQLGRKKDRFSVAVPALLRQHGRVCPLMLHLLCLPCRQLQFQLRGTFRVVQTFSICLIAAVLEVVPPSGLHIVLFLHPWTNAQTPVHRFKGGIGLSHHRRTILGALFDHGVWTQSQRSLLPPQPLTKLVGIRHSLTIWPPPLLPQYHARMASALHLPRASTRQMAYSRPHLLRRLS